MIGQHRLDGVFTSITCLVHRFQKAVHQGPTAHMHRCEQSHTCKLTLHTQCTCLTNTEHMYVYITIIPYIHTYVFMHRYSSAQGTQSSGDTKINFIQ